jgi:hypothetical protein
MLKYIARCLLRPTNRSDSWFNIQRLLDEGLFTASYKFALLLALAVLSIEQADDSGGPLELTTDAIAEKFVEYYWRQVAPYVTAGEATILQPVVEDTRGTEPPATCSTVPRVHRVWVRCVPRNPPAKSLAVARPVRCSTAFGRAHG